MALKLLAQESLTVSTTAVGITASVLRDSDSQPLNIIEAHMAHVSGGAVFHSSSATAPVGGGTAGEIPQANPDKWVITGREDIEAWQGIVKTSEADATINMALYGLED